MRRLTTFWKAAGVAAVLSCALLAACRPIATGEDDSSQFKQYQITEVVVFPATESHRVQLQKTSAREDERVGISILEGDAQFIDQLRIETVENGFAIQSSRETGSNIHEFTMPNGDVRIEVVFTWTISDNAKLRTLNPSTGTLIPAFSPDVTDYVMEFHTSQAVSLAFNPIPDHPGAGKSTSVTAGKTLAPLSYGVTVYTVVVTPQDTTAPDKVYTVTVKKYRDASLSRIEVTSPAETSESSLWTTGLDIPAGPYFAKLPWVNSAPGNAVLTIATVDSSTTIAASGAVTNLASKTATIALGYGEEKRVVIDTSTAVEGLVETRRYEVVLSRYDGQVPVLRAAGGDTIRVLWNAATQRWEETHIFTTTGNSAFSWTGAIPAGVTGSFLVVAGGGGGGGATYPGGGGGAGGYAGGSGFPLTDASYAVTVGAGGFGGPKSSETTAASIGESSVFGPVTVSGGGFGSRRWNTGSQQAPSGGGSGGGGVNIDGGLAQPGVCSNPALSSLVQFFGNNGGRANTGGDAAGTGGGAGGAGFSQGSSRNNEVRAGGPGRTSGITGKQVLYAQGGAASNNVNGPTQNEPANSGNGGMGGWNSNGKPGASGIVVVRFPL